MVRVVAISSPSGAVYYLKALARKGEIELREKHARGIYLPGLRDAIKAAVTDYKQKHGAESPEKQVANA